MHLAHAGHAEGGDAAAQARSLELLVVTVGNRLGIPFKESAQVARTLEDNWFDTPGSLVDLTAACTAELGIRQAFASALRVAAGAIPTPAASFAPTPRTLSTASLIPPKGASASTNASGSRVGLQSPRRRSASPEAHLERMRMGREQKHQDLYGMRISSRRYDQVQNPWVETTSFRRSTRPTFARAGSDRERTIAGMCSGGKVKEMCAEIALTEPNRPTEAPDRRSRNFNTSLSGSRCSVSCDSPRSQTAPLGGSYGPPRSPRPWSQSQSQSQSRPITPMTPTLAFSPYTCPASPAMGASPGMGENGASPRTYNGDLKQEGSFKVALGKPNAFLAGA